MEMSWLWRHWCAMWGLLYIKGELSKDCSCCPRNLSTVGERHSCGSARRSPSPTSTPLHLQLQLQAPAPASAETASPAPPAPPPPPVLSPLLLLIPLLPFATKDFTTTTTDTTPSNRRTPRDKSTSIVLGPGPSCSMQGQHHNGSLVWSVAAD